ncbi:MAG: TonB-dependent receptor [Xanthomonadales bacterium]|nr:TonB-dependent receptor [Xanthomonadales bacterium]
MSKNLVDAVKKNDADHEVSSKSTSSRLIKTLLASTALFSIGNASAATDDNRALEDKQPLLLAQADTNAASKSDSNQNDLEEVLVTAKARKYRPDDQSSATGLNMKLIDTPQAISILTTEMLEVAGSRSIYDAVTLMPGVVDSGRGYGRDRVLIRGNTSANHRVNGTAMRTFRSVESYMVERIEVVRGPATALYGVSSNFGGEINQLLKAPQEEFAATFGIEVGDFDMKRYTADVTGAFPSTDGRLKGRVVGVFENSGSWVDVQPRRDNDYGTVMAALSYDFSDNTQVKLTGYKSKVSEDPFEGGFIRMLPDPGCTSRDCRKPALIYEVPPERWYFSDPRHSMLDTDYKFFIGELNHQLSNDWDFKSRLSYSKYDQQISYFYPFGPAGAYALGDDEVYQYTYDEDAAGSELSFNMSLTGDFELFNKPWEFHAAFEYNDSLDPTELKRLRSIYIGKINIYQGGLGVLSNGTPWALPDRSTLPVTRLIHSIATTYTGSVQVVAHPTEHLQILLGVLTQKEDSLGTVRRFGNNPLPAPIVTPYSFTKTVPRLGITYDVIRNPGVLTDGKLYFSYSNGFRSNGALFDNSGNLISKPQEMEQWEVGFKFEMLDGQMGGSIAWFDSDIQNVPVSSSYLGGFATSGSTLEGLQATKGLETEVVGQILPGWNVSANYTYMDSEISDPNFAFTAQIQGVPEHSAAFTTSYQFLEGPATGLILGTNISYVGDREFVNGLNRQPRFGSLVTDAFARMDLYASYDGFKGVLEGFQLYSNIENIFDEDYFHTPIAAHPGFNINRGTPRRFTVGLRYTFD